MLLLAISYILNVVSVVISEHTTCTSLTEKPHFKLQHCTFLPSIGGYANSSLRCDILNRIKDYENYVDNTFYLHIKLLFEIIEPVASTTWCLRLSSFNVDKVTAGEPWNNVTTGEISANVYAILRYVKNGFIKTKFRNMYPVALLQLDTDCYQQSASCNPNNKVNFLRQIEESVATLDFFNGSSWQIMKNWYHSLGGYDTQIMLDLDPGIGLIKPQYISFIISDISMTYLRLTGGKWGHLDKSLIKNKRFLKVLDLTNNGINDIHIDTFLETPELETLILANNALKEIPSGIGRLRRLRSLDLSNNKINKQNSLKEIRKLSSLKALSISYMKLRDLRNFTCQSEFQLEILMMSHCDIQLLKADDLQCQKQLKILDLSYNKLREIPSEIVSVQKNLVALNIANNLFTNGPNLILHNNITMLKISNNRLIDMSSIIATGHVEFLDLSGNNVSSWFDESVFEGKVKKLNISRNGIKHVTREMIESFKSLETIDLGDNLFDCSYCFLPFFQLWLLENSTGVLYNLGEKQPLTCSFPLTERDKNIIEVDVDISPCISDNTVSVCVSFTIFMIYMLALTAIIVSRYRRLVYMHLCCKNVKKLHDSNVTYEYDAFICYSQEDRDWVIQELLPILENEPSKYRLRLDERDIILSGVETRQESHLRFFHNFIQSFKPPGLSTIQKTVRSMQTSKNTIMILSNNFIKNEWCRWELELANHKLIEDQGDFLILIKLEELDQSAFPFHWEPLIKYLMDTCTYVKWPQENQNIEKAWKKLRNALGPSLYDSNEVNKDMVRTSMHDIITVDEEMAGTSMDSSSEEMAVTSMDSSRVICVDEKMAIITN